MKHFYNIHIYKSNVQLDFSIYFHELKWQTYKRNLAQILKPNEFCKLKENLKRKFIQRLAKKRAKYS